MGHAILLFDGVCNYCNACVDFIIRRDPGGYFRFAALQSPAGQDLLKKYSLPSETLDSVVLFENKQTYLKSSASVRIARHLSGAWPLAYGFIIVPPIIRNAVYDIVAKNRYRWFGKRDSCRIPTPDEQQRFLI